jgi:hypothetical protein
MGGLVEPDMMMGAHGSRQSRQRRSAPQAGSYEVRREDVELILLVTNTIILIAFLLSMLQEG